MSLCCPRILPRIFNRLLLNLSPFVTIQLKGTQKCANSNCSVEKTTKKKEAWVTNHLTISAIMISSLCHLISHVCQPKTSNSKIKCNLNVLRMVSQIGPPHTACSMCGRIWRLRDCHRQLNITLLDHDNLVSHMSLLAYSYVSPYLC